MPTTITVRRATDGDAPALSALAELDSARPLPRPVLVAESGGQLRAALSLADGSAVGDPFHPTAGLVELLRVHAAQLTAPQRERRLRHAAQVLSPRALLRAS